MSKTNEPRSEAMSAPYMTVPRPPSGLAGPRREPPDHDHPGSDADNAKPAAIVGDALRVAWIDAYTLTRECVVRALQDSHPQLLVYAFASVASAVIDLDRAFHIIVYYHHRSDGASLEDIAELGRRFDATPVLILSDADNGEQAAAVRRSLTTGAEGFISTRTTGVSMAVAAMRFVLAGGTLAPREMLLAERPSRGLDQAESVPATAGQAARFTPRQMAVLSQLQQGKANKKIAHELGMSESTVKVHVRNVMRKLGVTNRTQAAFKAFEYSNDLEKRRSQGRGRG
jgi:DNA-binding NarL/FixJ family response regulator